MTTIGKIIVIVGLGQIALGSSSLLHADPLSGGKVGEIKPKDVCCASCYNCVYQYSVGPVYWNTYNIDCAINEAPYPLTQLENQKYCDFYQCANGKAWRSRRSTLGCVSDPVSSEPNCPGNKGCIDEG